MTKNIRLIKGMNGSFAQKITIKKQIDWLKIPNLNPNQISQTSFWVVYGAPDAVSGQTDSEYAYQFDGDADDILSVPWDVPIHAGITDFKKQAGPITTDYETAGDLYDLASDIMDDLSKDPDIAPNLAKNKTAMRREIMQAIWQASDWASLSTIADEIEQDIAACNEPGMFDAYPHIYKLK